MGSSNSAVTGYWYKIGMHMVICNGPVDAVTELRVGDRQAWTGNVTANTIISITKPYLFGGETKEGGVSGNVDIRMGAPTQTNLDGYLSKKLTAPIPAFRGVLSIVLRGTTVAANNPYIKPWAVKVKRILAGWYGGTAWYAAKAPIGANDMNPAHIIYQCITDPNWGMGYPTSSIDDATFTAVADTLYTENFGLSMLWNQQASVGDFIQSVLNHVGGMLYADPQTGKFALKLLRDDYNPATLPVFDPSNTASLLEYQRATWGETVNEITVVYNDRTTGKSSAITVQDLASITSQGAVVNKTIQYPGIYDATLAARVAMRDLRLASSPLAKVKLAVNRQAWALFPGDVFALSWPALGITSMICRVLQVGGGTLTSGTITVDAVEDVFGLPSNAYAAQQATSWVDPSTLPAPCPAQKLVEATYWEIVRSVPEADRAYFVSTTSFLRPLGQRPSGDAIDYAIMSRPGGGSLVLTGRGNFTPTCTVLDAMVAEVSTTVEIDNAVDLESVTVGSFALIDNELMAVTALNDVALTITFDRAVLDTTPAAHAAGSRIWFYDGGLAGNDPTEYSSGENVYAKLLPLTGQGQLDPANATEINVAMTGRWSKPYAPGNFLLEGSAYPVAVGGLTIAATWAHRDRTLQTATLIPQTTGNIGPEVGTTYTVTWYNAAGGTIQTTSGITGTTDSVTLAAFTNKLRCKITSVRSGINSYQSQDHTCDLAGYGRNYGLYYGMGV